MGWQATQRAADAAARRQQREAQKRRRELERQSKEQAKLSAIEQARFEVSTFENRLELLLSVHREQGPVWDWHKIATSLPPPAPQRHSFHELRARQQACLLISTQPSGPDPTILQARLRDEQDYQQAIQAHTAELSQLATLTTLARRILSGELKAYTEALVELSPLGEISELGSTIHFTVHNAQVVEAVLKVKGTAVIPSEVKSLTSTGKLSVKPMPRMRFHELYQDYICGCVLRVAREVFALLPVTTVLVTAFADGADPTTTPLAGQAVLSAAIPRATMTVLDSDPLDPSDVIEELNHRGDFKTSRGVGTFASIVPLSPDDVIITPSPEVTEYDDLVAQVRGLRERLRASVTELNQRLPSAENS